MNSVLSHTLDDAVALVTGACGGIGRSVCEALRAAGAIVVASDLAGCDGPGDSVADAWFRHDVTSPNEWQRVVGKVQEMYGRIDCLVNNAGMSFVETIGETSIDQWRRVMTVNAESVLIGMKTVIPLLRVSGEQRSGGSSIVNISSIAGLRGGALNGAYGASKAALTLLSKSAAKEFATLRYPIRVNSVHPGVVATEMSKLVLTRCVEVGLASTMERQQAIWDAMSPLGRVAQPEEIAGAVTFLCSPAAGFITGCELCVDGGATA